MAWYSDALQNGYAWSPPDRYDYSVPLVVGTVITSPVDGTVLPDGYRGAGYGRKPWGGQVDILSDLPEYGGPAVVDTIHYDTIDVQPGQQVKQGQRLGTSGGQLSGGNWPVTDAKFSTGPHIGVAVKSFADTPTYFDPHNLIADLVAGRLSSQPAGGTVPLSFGTGTLADSSSKPKSITWLDIITGKVDFAAYGWRAMKILAGAAAVIVAIVMLLLPTATGVAKEAVAVASPVAGIAANVATAKLRGKQSGEIDRLAANREKRAANPPRDRRFVGERVGGRTKTQDIGEQAIATPVPGRASPDLPGTVTQPAKGTERTGFPGANAARIRARRKKQDEAGRPQGTGLDPAQRERFRQAAPGLDLTPAERAARARRLAERDKEP